MSITDTIESTVNDRLDAVEARLPDGLATSTFRFQRTVACTSVSALGRVGASAQSSAANLLQAQRRAYRTVSGTADMAVDTIGQALRTLRGQTAAQARQLTSVASEEAERVAETAGAQVEAAVDAAVDIVEAAEQIIGADTTPTGETFDDLTKQELYRRAKAADIEGRSQMSKAELVAALEATA